MKIDELQEGMTLNNNELMDTFLCSSQGGMRRSKRTNSLVLISDQTKLYNDRWQGDILHYTGMGQTGDQDFSYIQKGHCTNPMRMVYKSIYLKYFIRKNIHTMAE